MIVLFGSQALGALIFGAFADLLGLVEALLIAAGSAAVAAASIRVWPFLETSGMNRSTVVYWPEPQLAWDDFVMLNALRETQSRRRSDRAGDRSWCDGYGLSGP